MSLDAGDAGCTHGLSKRIFDNWSGDVTNGFSAVLTAGQLAALKSTCYQQALAIVAEVQADFVHADCYTSSTQSIPNATYTVINFDSVTSDPSSAVTTGAAWHFTVPTGKGGIYLVSTSVSLSSGAGGGLFLSLLKNGSEYRRGVRYNMTSGINEVQLNATVTVAAGDTLALAMFQGTGAAQSLEGGSSLNTWLSIVKLVGS